MKGEKQKVFAFIKRNPWIVNMWKEYEKVRNEYYKKINQIEQKYSKIAIKHKIKDIWFASTIDDGIFGIDVNNVQMCGEDENRFLIHDSDMEKLKNI